MKTHNEYVKMNNTIKLLAATNKDFFLSLNDMYRYTWTSSYGAKITTAHTNYNVNAQVFFFFFKFLFLIIALHICDAI